MVEHLETGEIVSTLQAAVRGRDRWLLVADDEGGQDLLCALAAGLGKSRIDTSVAYFDVMDSAGLRVNKVLTLLVPRSAVDRAGIAAFVLGFSGAKSAADTIRNSPDQQTIFVLSPDPRRLSHLILGVMIPGARTVPCNPSEN